MPKKEKTKILFYKFLKVPSIFEISLKVIKAEYLLMINKSNIFLLFDIPVIYSEHTSKHTL